MADGISREPSEAMATLDQLDELVRKAHSVPLSDQVRVDRQKVEASLDRLRAALSRSEAASRLDELDTLIHRARPVPLIDHLRVARAEIYDVLDWMRATIADEGRA